MSLATALMEQRWRFTEAGPLESLLARMTRVIPAGLQDWAVLRHIDGLRHWQDYR